MDKTNTSCISTILKQGEYQFLILELPTEKPKDVNALLQIKLETLLPHGLDGILFHFTQIGDSNKYLITLIKMTSQYSISPTRMTIPFLLRIPSKEPIVIRWESDGGNFCIQYEHGLAQEFSTISSQYSSNSESSKQSPSRLPLETRRAIGNGPAIQGKISRSSGFWKVLITTLIVFLIAQFAFFEWSLINAKLIRLYSLNEQISTLQNANRGKSISQPTSRTQGLQMSAFIVQQEIESRWLDDYYLTKWTLKKKTLTIEGWGPNALALIASLRLSPSLHELAPSSIKKVNNIDIFIFSGEVIHDYP